jgi:hypothetical protein
MKLTKNKEFNEDYRIFYKHGAWYGYCEYKYKSFTNSNTIRRYNDELITYGYLENGYTKIFYI